MNMLKYNEIFEDDTHNITKIPKSEYKESGDIPIIDQGKEFVAGYSDNYENKKIESTRIIFGDHTRIIKFVDFKAYIGADGVKVLKIKNKNADYKYMYYYLKKSYIPDTGYNRHYKWLKELKFNLPLVEEQKRISNKLDKAQEIIDIRKKQIEDLENLIKSQFIELFGKIDKRIKVKECCSKITDYVASGSFASIRQNVKYYNNPEYAIMVRTADFANNFSENLTYTDKHGYDFLHNSNLFGGELLLSNIGASIGKVHRVPYLNVPMTLAPNAIMLKGNKEYLEDYLQYYFLSDEGQVQLKSMTTATAMPKFNKTQLKEVEIIKAPIELQNQFAKIVQQINKQKIELQKNLEEMEKLQESLMNKYFGG